MGRQGTEGYQGRERALFITVMATWSHTFAQTHRNTTPRVKPEVNYGLWVMIMCQRKLSDCNQCPTPVGEGGNRGGGRG